MSKKSKALGNAYRVFQDVQRHTCIRVNTDPKGVHFIPWDTTSVDVKLLSNREFEQTYTMELMDYPVKRAAESYLNSGLIPISEAAKFHLVHLTGGKYKETAIPLDFHDKESVMTAEAQEAAATKKAAKTKVTAPKAEGKAKKGAPAPEAKKAKTKVAAPEAAERGTRTSKEAGRKIKVLEKNPAVRPGSNREAQFGCILSSKTTDEAAEKLREYTNKPWDVVRVAVAQGIIELV